jgi:hypothetical protein
MLLKITHLPIVGAICLFERINDRVGGGAIAFSSMGPTTQTDLGRSSKKQIPFLSKSNGISSKHTSQHYVDIPNVEGSLVTDPQTPIANEAGNGTQTVIVSNVNLEKLVEDLSTKIAELTALVMAQQGSSGLPDESF